MKYIFNPEFVGFTKIQGPKSGYVIPLTLTPCLRKVFSASLVNGRRAAIILVVFSWPFYNYNSSSQVLSKTVRLDAADDSPSNAKIFSS